MYLTTLKSLENDQNMQVIHFNDWVIVLEDMLVGDVSVDIFKLYPTSNWCEESDTAVKLIHSSEDRFEDSGHAIKWAFEMIEES
ncbi:hypothetical protein [Streptococcus cuniculi]|uniref:Nucleotide modification associated domain-containing protein n=1 Tax=Streptococcus cuniculi TaxID=1432788 RepID=A0A4Y9JB91_9STRE|nr:hypothetical protein [Streptococcus cuniculi]MBF0778722.1 hypothetical protein [Streptococcus cuniculi]TFU97356.1 hypothetical protein E4T82_08310 [Streptococcus cuniculi]